MQRPQPATRQYKAQADLGGRAAGSVMPSVGRRGRIALTSQELWALRENLVAQAQNVATDVLPLRLELTQEEKTLLRENLSEAIRQALASTYSLLTVDGASVASPEQLLRICDYTNEEQALDLQLADKLRRLIEENSAERFAQLYQENMLTETVLQAFDNDASSCLREFDEQSYKELENESEQSVDTGFELANAEQVLGSMQTELSQLQRKLSPILRKNERVIQLIQASGLAEPAPSAIPEPSKLSLQTADARHHS